MTVSKDFKPANSWPKSKQRDHLTGLVVIGLIVFALLAGIAANMRDLLIPTEDPAPAAPVAAVAQKAQMQMYNDVLQQPEAATSKRQIPLVKPRTARSSAADDKSPMAFFTFYEELPNRQIPIGDAGTQALRPVQPVKPKLQPDHTPDKPALDGIMLPPPPVQTKKVTRPLTTESPVSGRGYIIQAGAFNNFAQADKVRDRLAALGFKAYVQAVTANNARVHRVRIGPIGDAGQAKAISRQLDSKGIKSITLNPN